MKIPRIANAVGHIDDDLIAAAAGTQRKTNRNPWIKWGGLAACFAVLLIAGAAIIPSLFDGAITTPGKYKYSISGTEGDVEWPWEYKTVCEKYNTVDFHGKEYITRTRAIDMELLGDILGTCEAEGVDSYTNKRHMERFEVRKIRDVSEEKLIAIGKDGAFYVYMLDDIAKPATFGELLDLYGLARTLEFSRFTRYKGYDEKGCFTVNDDAYIWQILLECRAAKLYEEADSPNRRDRRCLSFTATSEALGVYKKVFYVTEDGYVSTNIFDYSYRYFIGEEDAGKIICYIDQTAVEAEAEPYEPTISGTLTEIGDGYVLLDDTVLCANKADGTVYKVSTDDIRIKRCIECTNLKVGDMIAVKYQGPISDNNEIDGGYSMYKGTLVDGDLAIPE